jgi:hypothetical protein
MERTAGERRQGRTFIVLAVLVVTVFLQFGGRGSIVYPTTLSEKTSKTPIDNQRLQSTSSPESIETPRHVVFSSYKCDLFDCSPVRRAAEHNSQQQWKNMSPHVLFLDFSNISQYPFVQVNKFDVPVFRSFFLQAEALAPDARSYTYVNGDILPEPTFFQTVDAWLEQQAFEPFLMVGQRTNVEWQVHYDVQDFDKLFQQGELFVEYAEDYFVVSNDTIAWEQIPPFVIGRRAYDNWLVAYAHFHQNITLIDITQTTRVIHQTDEEGNVAHGGNMNKNKADREYNIQFLEERIKHYVKYGSISIAEYFSSWDPNQTILFQLNGED